MAGHCAAPIVTLAVTDQSGPAESTISPRLHCDAIISHLARKSHIDSCRCVTAHLLPLTAAFSPFSAEVSAKIKRLKLAGCGFMSSRVCKCHVLLFEVGPSRHFGGAP